MQHQKPLQNSEVFVEAIDEMSVTDAQAILSGGKWCSYKLLKYNTSDVFKKINHLLFKKQWKENQVASVINTGHKSKCKRSCW